MIDTIGVRFHLSPTQEQLQESWVGLPLQIPGEDDREHYFQNAQMSTEVWMRFEYNPPNIKYEKPSLNISVSLPKAMYGENVSMICDEEELEESISGVNQFIETLSWVPSVDIGEGYLYRVDVAYNHDVGEWVPDYIEALFQLQYPRRKTKPYYPEEGVQFYSTVATTSFYDKYEESKLNAARGMLRQETSLRRNTRIGKRMGVDKPRLRDVTKEWAIEMLRHDLEVLGLQERIITDRDMALEILVRKYGYNTGSNLYGHWCALQTMTREQMIEKGCSERTIRERNRRITDVGIAMTSVGEKVVLPPLEIVL